MLLLQPISLANAMELTQLEPQYDSGSQIEFATPAEGYNFDVNFLAKEQSLTYQATVHNDEAQAIEITGIDFTNSSYSFLDYSYDGITIGDKIEAGESQSFIISIQTNNQPTETVAEDLSLTINYQKLSPPAEDPDEDTNEDTPENPVTNFSIILPIILAIGSITLIAILVSKNKRRALAIALALPFAGLLLGHSFAHAESSASFTILGKVRFTNIYTVTIDPNGGNYAGETELKLREGAIFSPSDVTRDTYEFTSWEVNPGELNENGEIEIHADTHFKALWNEIYYTLTINPNGGTYRGSTENYTESFRPHSTTEVEASSKQGYDFDYYIDDDGQTFAGGSLQIEKDITLTAHYTIQTLSYTIDPNGGSYDGHTSSYATSANYGDLITMGDATREHYRFTGWAMSVGALDENKQFTITQAVTLTAQWEPINFTLTIDPNTGTYGDHTEEFGTEYLEGTVVNLTTPTKEHYHFDYWILEDESQFTESSVTITRDIKLVAHYSIDQFHVTVNPNGGTYKGSTETYSQDVDYGTELTLRDDTARENYVLSGWTKNTVSGALDRDTESITITEDTDLVAEWNETRLVTVDPNGGVYDGSSEPSTYRVEINTTFTLDDATKENWALDGWTVDDSYKLDGNSKKITADTTFRAEWFFPVARIERTQKLYPSIMAAHEEAQSNDIITLLVDTEEVVHNEKKVTLDLNYHTVTGYLYNRGNGDITLVNGEINNYTSPIHNEENPAAAAVVNAGKLTMGIDDYTGGETNQKTPLISGDNIRLIGTDIGLSQTGEFYFYDGFIEGIIGLAGGYNGSPWYRDTFDGIVVNYFPFVDRNIERDCQHVELENSDKAVSKTIVGGEIYYYNLQDNINTSARTGFDIYAVRDFDASYPITVAEDTEIVFDLYGYNVNFGEDSVVNGELTVRDSKTGDEAGTLALSKTMTNNGTLVFTDAQAKAVTVNNFLINNGNLEMHNSTISSDKSITLVVQQNGSTYNLDNNSYIRSSSTDKPVVQNSSTDLNITSGHIISDQYIAIKNTNGSALTISGGEVGVNNNTVSYNSCAIYGEADNITLTMTGGRVFATSTSGYTATAICGIHANISDGEVVATSNSDATAINGASRTINVSNKANISATAYSQARAISGNWQTATISGNETVITATSTGYGYATITDGDYGSTTINGGTLTTQSNTGSALITNDMEKTITINGGTMTARSTNGDVLAIGVSGRWASYVTINGGTISAIADNSNKVGTGVSSYNFHMTGGEIYGSTYGIRDIYDGGLNVNSITGGKVEGGTYGIYNTTITLGVNDIIDNKSNISITDPEIKGGINAIRGGRIYFYDGILKGGDDYINDENVILAIPDGAHLNIEQAGDEEHCWLVEDEDYLEVNGQTFNSLTGAYAVVEDGGTINVIADASTAAVLPNNDKNITFNLGNHTVTYMQPLLNSGSITFTGNGNLVNAGTTFPTIQNSGTITIESGHIISNHFTAIKNMQNSSMIMTGGEVSTINNTVQYSSCTVFGDSNNITLTMTGGKISATSTSGYTATAICGMHANISGGEISATSNTDATTINGASRTINISNGTVATATSTNGGSARVISGNWQTVNISDDNTIITATANGNGSATITDGDYGSTTINGGTLTSETVNGTAFITNDMEKTITINGGTLTAHSTNGDVLAIGTSGRWSSSIYVNGGTISAIADNPDKTGTGATGYYFNMTDGEIYGTTYGVNEVYSSYKSDNVILGGKIEGGKNGLRNTHATLGNNDTINGRNNISITNPEIKGGIYAINGGSIFFYDGILKGGDNYINDTSLVLAVPDGSHRHVERVGTEEHCWLVDDEDYLEVNGETFNSLTGAYAAVEDGGIINVIADATTQAVLPSNTKNITFNLGEHTLNYQQPLKNSGSITFVGTGYIINSNNSSATIENNGTITIQSGHIVSSGATAIKNLSNSTINMTGGEVYTQDLRADYSCAINSDGSSTLNMTGGKISATSSEQRSVTAICNVNADISGGEVSASSKSDATAINGGSRTVKLRNGATVTATSTNGGSARIVSGNWQTLIVSDDSTTLHASTNNSGYATISDGDYGSTTINGGTLSTETVNGTATVINDMEKTITINGGTMTAHSTNGDSYGIGTSGRWAPYITINDGKITAISDNSDKAGTGVFGYNLAVTGGEIYGSTYGIRDVYTSDTVIGVDDNVVNNGLDGTSDKPYIHGGLYGIYGSSFKFYDGILEGSVAPHFDRNIKGIAEHTNVYYGQSTIEDQTFQTAYLIAEQDVAKIGDTADAPTYKSLDAAIADAQENDTIYLIRDAYIYSTLNIPSDKKFTLDLDGNNIIAASHIDNSGDVTIVNSNSNKPVVEYHDSDPFIQNRANANLVIDGISFKANRIAENRGTLTFANSTLESYTSPGDYYIRNYSGILNLDSSTVSPNSGTYAIYIDNGGFNFNNSTIESYSDVYAYNLTADSTISGSTLNATGSYSNYVFYNDNSNAKLTISDDSKLYGDFYTKSVNLNIKDSLIQQTTVRDEDVVHIEGGTAVLDNVTIKHTHASYWNPRDYRTVIYSTGTITIKNSNLEQSTTSYADNWPGKQLRIITNTGTLSLENTIVTQNDVNSGDYNSIAVYNSGNFTMLGSTITTTRSLTSAYGFYNDGTATIDTSTITVTGKNAYGIYANSGELTLGEAEPQYLPDGTVNPNYGKATANVSTSTPLISAIGTNDGVAATINAGKLNFYDGKLYQSNPNGPALQPDGSPVALTKVEYLYQAESYQDIYNNYYFILEFMRN